MAEDKKKHRRKSNSSNANKKGSGFKNNKRKNFSNKNGKGEDTNKRARRGPRLPNALRKELDGMNRRFEDESGSSDGGEDVDYGALYEFEEGVAEEESRKNRRYDRVDNYEPELGSDFEDENVVSDDEDLDNDKRDDNEEDNSGRHIRMLQGVTGLPQEVFEGKKKKDLIVTEMYPANEFNPTSDIVNGTGLVTIEDLMDPLHGKPGFSKLRKNLGRLEDKPTPIHPPLPKQDLDKLDRKAAYEVSKKTISNWEHLVKRNREAPTLFFDEDLDLGFSTVGAIASEFEPRTDFEKRMASVVNNNEVVEAHKKDGARLLELNKISIEEVKDRRDRLAKMRSLLFHHELKMKRIKKIKSKTYHRLLKKDKSKSTEAVLQTDPEAAKHLAMKQEYKRAQERMTLKHKNSSKWAKRILERGLQVQDVGTRNALAEQLNQHAALTRKMNSIRESSSSDESSDDDDMDEMSAGSDIDKASELINKAKKKTIEALEGDEELPQSGVFSLPFMVRGLKKKKEAADEEAKLAFEEYDSLKQLEDGSGIKSNGMVTSSGRRVFGAPRKQIHETNKKVKADNYYNSSDEDDDDDVDAKEDEDNEHGRSDLPMTEVNIDPDILREVSGIVHDPALKHLDLGNPRPRPAYEVAILSSDNIRSKVKKSSEGHEQAEANIDNAGYISVPEIPMEQEENNDTDTDSGGEMVDGILTSSASLTYELPSQAELIRRAFAGDDVEEEFEKDKEAVLNDENPEPEKPVLLPGWGQWTDIQKKKGLPSWMLEEHDAAKTKREEALKKRKDAHLSNVIISEKLDKKAEKLHTKTLPYPYTSKEVFEQSIRMPIGPEFNPATAIGALNRPEVVKKTGLIIEPIKYEDINPHAKTATKKSSRQKQKKGKDNARSVRK